MTREEIREGINQQIELAILGVAVNVGCNPDGDIGGLVREARKLIVGMLHKKGVVIKVNRKLPHLMPECPNNEWSAGYCCGEEFMQEIMIEAGYVATEPLIKEEEK